MIINGNKLPEKATVLGEIYKFYYETEDQDPKMKGNDGYTETAEREIHIEKTIFDENKDDVRQSQQPPPKGRGL